jgi:hypothetical protein
MIKALCKTIRRHPDEYILYYSLADHLQQFGSYAQAMPVCKKILVLRTRDIRSSYIMATNYYCLTRRTLADMYWDNDTAEELEILFDKIARGSDKNIIRNKSASELKDFGIKSEMDKLRIDIDTAAAEANKWFKKVSALNPDNESLNLVEQHLAALHQRFPALGR